MRLCPSVTTGPLGPGSVCSLLVFLTVLLSVLFPVDSITITTVLAGKKKFRSYDLGFKFLPTLVKVKPNRLALSFRGSRYIRPPKFKIEGSIPLKIPTIIMEKPDPYEKPQIININKVIKLGEEMDKPAEDYKAAGTDEQAQVQEAPDDGNNAGQESNLPPGDQMSESFSSGGPPMGPPFLLPPPGPFMAPPVPFEGGNSFPPMPPMMALSEQHGHIPVFSFPNHDLLMTQLPPDQFKAREQSRTRRSLNLHEPYHHHLGDSKVPRLPPFLPPPPPPPPFIAPVFPPPPPHSFPFGFPKYGSVHGPFPHPPRANFFPYPLSPWQAGPILSKQDNTIPEQQQFVMSEGSPAVEQQQPTEVIAVEANGDSNSNRDLVPMKINIGEHYNPNQYYMDESIVPSLDDVPLVDPASVAGSVEEPAVDESTYQQQYHKPAYQSYKNTGPDDFRVSFSFSGVHGGPLVPLGTGDNIEQYYKQLKKFEGNNLPVGLPREQLQKYYRAHTFTDGIHVYRMTPSKVIRAKLIKALFG